MRIVFAGSGTFGLPTLRTLLGGGQEVPLIVTQPDRPAGRGRLMRMPPVKRFARDEEIPLYQPEDVNDARARRRLAAAEPDMILTVAFGQKLGDRLLALPEYGGINLHASLLPKYRGAAPVNWALVNGEPETGVTVIEMSDRIDAGDILGQCATHIEPDETAGELHDRLAVLGARLVSEIVRELPLDEVARRRQNETQATFAPRLAKADGLIRWDLPAGDVHNRIRGMTPWPGAFTFLPVAGEDPLRLTVNRSTLREEEGVRGEPGEVLAAGPDGIDVAAARGAVRLLELTPAGKRAMPAAAFLHGYDIPPGVCFTHGDD